MNLEGGYLCVHCITFFLIFFSLKFFSKTSWKVVFLQRIIMMTVIPLNPEFADLAPSAVPSLAARTSLTALSASTAP